MVCGKFREGVCKRIVLDNVREVHLAKLLRLACGSEEEAPDRAEELLGLAELADRLQMEPLTAAIEEVLVKTLDTGSCVETLRRSEAIGMRNVQAACCRMLLEKFEDVSRTEGFLQLSEETLEGLLDDVEFCVDREEFVFAAMVRWMTGGGDGLRGNTLLGKIRYGLMDDEYLADSLPQALPGQEELRQLVGEATARKKGRTSGGGWDGVVRLCDKWDVPRCLNFQFLGSGVLKCPTYVAVTGRGHIIVTDDELHEVLMFNRSGSLQRRFGSKGSAPGQFYHPRGVAVDRQGHIIVADSFNHRIQVLNADGTVVGCFGTKGSNVGQLSCPQGVAIDGEGHIVVADNDNHRIQVFDRGDGSVVRHFGTVGSFVFHVGQFWFPEGVAVDGAGRIVVAGRGNHRVQAFDSEGCFALCFGSEGGGPGKVALAAGIAVDKESRLVIADYGNHRVEVINWDGSVARVMGARGCDVGQLEQPWGVAVDSTGRILVADSGNGRVQVF